MRLEMLMILVWVGGMFCQLFVCDTEAHCTTTISLCFLLYASHYTIIPCFHSVHLCVLSVNLRKNGDYFSIQHQVIAFITGTALI